MSIRRRLVVAFLTILQLFAANLTIYFWGNQKRQSAFDAVRRGVERQSVVVSINQHLNDIQKQMTLLSAMVTDADAVSTRPSETAEFKAQLGFISGQIDTLRELSTLEERPRVEALSRAYGDLAAKWLIVYEDFGVHHSTAITELVLHADPLSRSILQDLLPQLHHDEEVRLEAANAEFYSLAKLVDRLAILIFFTSTILGIGLAYFVSHHLTGALTELSTQAALIGSGRLDQRIMITSRDELGQLAQAFNEMSAKLAERDKQLGEIRGQLEIRVQERTAELAKVNEALRESEGRAQHQFAELEQLYETAPVGLCFVNRELRYVRINERLAALNGAPVSDHVGRLIRDIIPLSAPTIEPHFQQVFESGRPILDLEFCDVISEEPGVGRNWLVSYYPVRGPEGIVVGVNAVMQDIGERKRLEVELRQAQKMEAIGRLAGGVAHDFNNLLTVINGYAEMVLGMAAMPSLARDCVEEVLNAGNRASALTNQLLAFSRRQVLQPRAVSLNDVVSNLSKMLHRVIGEDIELVSVLAPGLGSVRADPNQMEQVLINLALNSRDAMVGGGRLTLTTAEVAPGEDGAPMQPGAGADRFVMLVVTDTGQGMDAETRRNIFEPFFTTKGQGKGTGLGLSTVYGIVKQSGGEIQVSSKPGEGTTFRLYFPKIEEEGAGPAGRKTAFARLPQGTETILLLEDDLGIRQLVRQMLLGQGYTVLEAQNWREAVRLCQEHRGPLQLLLTDVVMPEMNGPAVAEHLTPLRPEMRVLFMSGYANSVMGDDGILQQSVAFLQKPFTRDELVQKVQEVLGSIQT
jgi:signal transduction histidine kinase/ActR/RegA family two-component response regulator